MTARPDPRNRPDHPWNQRVDTGRRPADVRAAIVAYYLAPHSLRATAKRFGAEAKAVRRYVTDAGHDIRPR